MKKNAAPSGTATPAPDGEPEGSLQRARRMEETKSKREIMRCPKRYIACEVYRVAGCTYTVARAGLGRTPAPVSVVHVALLPPSQEMGGPT